MWFNTLAPVFDGDKPRLGPDGTPEFIMAFMTPDQVGIVDTWHVTGLRASASHDLRVENTFVPTELAGAFSMRDLQPVRACRLARIPFMNLLAIVQAPPVCLGIARHAVDAFVDIAKSKERGGSRLTEQATVQAAIAQAEAKIRAGRAYFYAVAERIWEKADGHEIFSEEDMADMRMACLTATENALAVVDAMYRLGGATSIFQSCPLERLWRDVHTASQHIQVQDSQWVGIGKSLLGIDAG